ncbi:MAG TPA: FAD-binding and (Fe-S)-binding domain-containing protein [Actinomycetota bacterium]|nr:FAD-binding and (Fe-S)-binding domain-containing protein [Actinomycetota bacterium]
MATGLEAALRRSVAGEVRFDDGTRGLYATDASNFRQVPIGVVIPRTVDDVIATHAACHEFGAPILARGCGTSLSGEAVNVAVVIDFSKYLNEIVEIDPDRKTARVQPGVVHDQLAAATKHYGLVFAPDPSTHAYCTIGGSIGNNSCGVHSVQARFLGEGSRTSDNVAELDVLTHDGVRLKVGSTTDDEIDAIVARGGRTGEIYEGLRSLRDRYGDLIRQRFPDIPRRVSGYNLDELLPENGFNVARALAGTEGTCATVLEATVKLVEDPPARSLVVVGYPTIFDSARHVMAILEHEPLGLEGLDYRLIQEERTIRLDDATVRLLPEGDAWLLVELGGATKEESDGRAADLVAALERLDHAPTGILLCTDDVHARRLWKVREAGLATSSFPPDSEHGHWPGWEDSAVAPEKLEPYLRDLSALYEKHGLNGAFYGHFGDGCVHSRISFDLRTRSGIVTYRDFLEEAADLVVSYGGSLSGEHGDGQQRAELLPKMYGDELVGAFREFKSIWDPDWRMNPGKVVDPHPFDVDLKLAVENYDPPDLPTHFSYAKDHGSFAEATTRCVGVGKCRRLDGGTMCPSFMVTREEKHTTRGRARMLFEMTQGDPVRGGWRDEDVKESLDLCLSCKACKADCPVGIDVATYKSEFLSHYYEGRRRPRAAYSLGLAHRWTRVASRVPNLANAVLQTPILSSVVKLAAGVAPQRKPPPIATQTLRRWFDARPAPAREAASRGRVVVWADTFTDFLTPGPGRAAIEVLESLGYEVGVSRPDVCCGRPLFDHGMLDDAKALLRNAVNVLKPEILAGSTIVGIEPSCIATFRDELRDLFPSDSDAQRLAENTRTFSEFLADEVGQIPWRLDGRALVHPHCHHAAVMGFDVEERLLRELGLEVQMSDAGCCGIAGSFGFEAGERYDLSVAIGERKLAPMVRGLDEDVLVVADGFSCRAQIESLTGRAALHVAEVVRLAAGVASDAPPSGPRLNRLEGSLLAAAGVATLAVAMRKTLRRA